MQQHPLELEVRDRLAAYVADKISLGEFLDWFLPTTWNVHQPDDLSLMDLIGEIELYWAEYTNGHRSDQELRDMFKPLGGRFAMCSPQTELEYGMSNRNIGPLNWII